MKEWIVLSPDETRFVYAGKCPDCGGPLNPNGPTGGLTLTYLCERGPTRITHDLAMRFIDGPRCDTGPRCDGEVNNVRK